MNKLQYETSPYLLQHAHNPVEWYAWKPEAFERAKAEQKPILVSIGYSTCHWCHVMERESFENEAVAALMNRYFINIKVDREERPDVDAIYMDACQTMTGGGGWPLNCFLTPEGKPFYAGTYFPPAPAHNRPSWAQLLHYLADIWENKRDTALEQADRLTGHIGKNLPPMPGRPENAESAVDLQEINAQIKRQFDLSAGGFGAAPKFPSTMTIQWLLEYFTVFRDTEALHHALFSLEKMISGGIYDQIGGGFSRYTTDSAWLVPHFEKMLYDNALMVTLLADAFSLVKDEKQGLDGLSRQYADLFQTTIQETLAYVAREMTSPEGGFYAAQDADSEGIEGKFYVWSKAEIESILGEAAAEFCAYYDVTAAGNWEGHNILHRPDDPGQHRQYVAQRQTLLEVRSKRIWPLLDTKILLDWNALMVTAHTRAYTALGDETYRQAATKGMAFILKHLRIHEPDGSTLPMLRHAVSQPYAFLDDYAFLIAALIDLYEITFEEPYLRLAEQYTAYVLQAFAGGDNPLFYFPAEGQNDILLRKKDLYDNATPAGNSVMAHNLQKLGRLLDRPEWLEKVSDLLKTMRPSVVQFPRSFSKWATAFLHAETPPVEIAVVGANAIEKALELQRRFIPNKIIAASPWPTAAIALLAGKQGAADAMIYRCQDYTCHKPVVSLEAFWDIPT